MTYHNKRIAMKSAALIVSILLLCLFVGLLVATASSGRSDAIALFIFLLLFMGLTVYFSYQELMEAINDNKKGTYTNLYSVLQNINPYHSYEELVVAFNAQTPSSLYQDDKIIITNEFLAKHDGKDIYIIDGILDVQSIVHSVNGVIDYVSLAFLYCDGKRYQIKYRRPLGFKPRMREKADSVNRAANILANRSKNFRKYPSYRLKTDGVQLNEKCFENRDATDEPQMKHGGKGYINAPESTVDKIRFCTKCGQKLPSGSKYCCRCGEKVIRME